MFTSKSILTTVVMVAFMWVMGTAGGLGGCGSSATRSASGGDDSTETTTDSNAVSAVSSVPAASAQVTSGSTASALSKLSAFKAAREVDGDFDENQFDEDLRDDIDVNEFNDFDGDDFDDFDPANCSDCQDFDLGDMGEGSLPSGMAMGACVFVSDMKLLFAGALNADLIKCYVGQMAEAYLSLVTAGTNEAVTTNIADGTSRYIALAFDGASAASSVSAPRLSTKSMEERGEEHDEGEGPDLIKLTIAKDSKGNISNFSMRACEDDVYTEYVEDSITAGATGAPGIYKSSSVRIHNDASYGTFSDEISVYGRLLNGAFVDSYTNAAGAVVSSPKVITLKHAFDETRNGTQFSSVGKLVGQQWDTLMRIRGYMTGSDSFPDFMTGEEQTCEFTDVFASVAELIDGEKTKDWKPAAGAAKMSFSGECQSNGVSVDSWNAQVHTEAWGANLQPVSTNAYVAKLANDVLKVETVDDPTLTASDMDCSATPDVTIKFNELFEHNSEFDIFAACDHLDGFQGGYMNCWHANDGDNKVDSEHQIANGDGFNPGELDIDAPEFTNAACDEITNETAVNVDSINNLCKCFEAKHSECQDLQDSFCFGQSTLGACIDLIESDVSDGGFEDSEEHFGQGHVD
jgi:hypothetical protein